MKYTIPDCGKGVNFDLLPSELQPGVWSSATNFRFRSGFAEAWEGADILQTTTSTPLWLMPFGGATRYGVYSSSTKVYAFTGAAQTDITRKTDGQVITNMTAVGTTVTVTTGAAHGLTAGVSSVTVYGAVPSAYNGTYAVVSTPTATSYTYTAASAPGTTPATVFGAYYVGSSTANFSALAGKVRYTGGAYNGLFLYNHPEIGLFYWSGDTSVALRRVPGFSGAAAYNTAAAVRPFKNYIVTLGKTQDSVSYRQTVGWSNAADPGSLPTTFTASATNDAGDVTLSETPGEVVDCLPLGDVNVVYKTDGRYAMQYIGGNEVFSFTRLPGSSGLAFVNCVVSTPVGHVFLTPDFDVMLHNGGEAKSLAVGRVKQFLNGNIDRAVAHLSFLCVNAPKNEVWVCYPDNNSPSVPNKALTWNWVEDTWGRIDFTTGATTASGVAFACTGQWPSAVTVYDNNESLELGVLHATDAAKTGLYATVEASGLWFDADLTCSLERQGLDCGDRDAMKTLQRSRWNMDNASALTVQHGSSKFADTGATYASSVTYTVGTTDYANSRATQGRFLAIKFSATVTSGNGVKLRSVDLDFTAGGKR